MRDVPVAGKGKNTEWQVRQNMPAVQWLGLFECLMPPVSSQ